jgi:ribosomal protein S18 acetylase RimI-like enzyme
LSDEVVIRRAEPGDGASIGLVHVRTWQSAYRGLLPQPFLNGLDAHQRGDYWEHYLSEGIQPGEEVVVAEEEGTVVGFASVGPSRDEDANGEGEVWAIYLSADRWGQGIGKALMDAALDSLRQAGFTVATLWVLDANERARRFYETGAWVPDGATKEDDRRGFPVTEVRYRRELEPRPSGN